MAVIRFRRMMVAGALCVLALAAPASAARIQFSYENPPLANEFFSFIIEDRPVFRAVDRGFVVDGVPLTRTINGQSTTTLASFNFFENPRGGGLIAQGISFIGDQLFTGTIANPTFQPGSFTGIIFVGSTSLANVDGRLRAVTIGETSAVPEPATWAMMIGGIGMAGAGLRRQRRSRITVVHS